MCSSLKRQRTKRDGEGKKHRPDHKSWKSSSSQKLKLFGDSAQGLSSSSASGFEVDTSSSSSPSSSKRRTATNGGKGKRDEALPPRPTKIMMTIPWAISHLGTCSFGNVSLSGQGCETSLFTTTVPTRNLNLDEEQQKGTGPEQVVASALGIRPLPTQVGHTSGGVLNYGHADRTPRVY